MTQKTQIIISVPFSYSATVVLIGKRKEERFNIKDRIDVSLTSVSSLSDLPIAFRVHYSSDDPSLIQDMPYFENTLWSQAVLKNHRLGFYRQVTLDDFQKNTAQNEFDPTSHANAANPFAAFVNHRSVEKSSINVKTWVSDNRDQVINSILGMQPQLLFIDGVLFQPAGEPRYVVHTLGLSGPDGSVSIAVTCSYDENTCLSSYFRADQRDECIAYATKLAKERSNKRSLPMKKPLQIDVITPELIQLRKTNYPVLGFDDRECFDFKDAVELICTIGRDEAQARVSAYTSKWTDAMQSFISSTGYPFGDLTPDDFASGKERAELAKLSLGLKLTSHCSW